MKRIPRLFVVVGSPGSGKDYLVRAINDMGARHAQIVPKHTSRERRPDDGSEMICPGDQHFALDKCDIVYSNYGDKYGIDSTTIWDGLKTGAFQVLVVSNVDAINKLRLVFGSLMTLIYVHSEVRSDKYTELEAQTGGVNGYVKRRTQGYQTAWKQYLGNYLAFDHVLIYAGAVEDLYDQIFRLFRAYEIG